MSEVPLGLYIHLPWCERKCPYCDFNSHAAEGILPQEQYIKALLQDLETDLEWGERFIKDRLIKSIFIGGGTPSLFDPSKLEYLLKEVERRVGFSHDIEITLEANPGSSEQKKFSALRTAGVNRLSLGIQSFTDTALQAIGRIHTAAESKKAVESAQAAGFDNLNLDLMYGLPNQTVAMAEHDFQCAIDFMPQHISAYQLTLEPNTLFFVKRPVLPDEEIMQQIEDKAVGLLSKHGYARYEISAYARVQKCAHNLNYWEYGDYLGIGAGAHAKLSGQGEIWRLVKQRSPVLYMQSQSGGQSKEQSWRQIQGKIQKKTQGQEINFCSSKRQIEASERSFEFMLNALRLIDGFTQTHFVQTTGLAFAVVQQQVDAFVQSGLMIKNGESIRLSKKGLDFLNDVQLEFLPDKKSD